ncbi:hypothetical protein EGW08_008466 [Elysia chlorotica]|uniref:Secreted protein n=1 Tax=Elysia chlorotica TaxID=188477 RepID=A0A3S0ZPC9_ELYCH|nr:hypothetical protein EGW08_008466 [Elysia chlorotica]
MPYHVSAVYQSAPALLVPVLLLLVVCCRPSLALCETRCEQSVPDLARLRGVWEQSFRRMGGRNISFNHFLLTLVREPTEGRGGSRRIRDFVLDVVGTFEECMVSCEHQFSKRSSDRHRPRPLRPRLRVKTARSGSKSGSRSKLKSRSILVLRLRPVF